MWATSSYQQERMTLRYYFWTTWTLSLILTFCVGTNCLYDSVDCESGRDSTTAGRAIAPRGAVGPEVAHRYKYDLLIFTSNYGEKR
jgi:hypothetical protein